MSAGVTSNAGVSMRAAVAVIGSGPAGSAAAVALAERGIDVVWIAADHERPWPATYCAWADELLASLIDVDAQPELTSRRWSGVTMVDERTHRVDRSYVVFDNDALRNELTQRAVAAGATLRRGDVASILERSDTFDDAAHVVLRDGSSVAATVVIDASGWPSMSGPGRPDLMAWQSAWGLKVHTEVLPESWRVDEPVLMDWRSSAHHDVHSVPTFAYALTIADGVTLVEETALASRPAMPHGVLRQRLLTRLGWTDRLDELERSGALLGIEQVRIPMGVAPPRRNGSVVPFGAAGGMVNPVTGYSVAASLREAPRLAIAVGEGLRAREPGPIIARRALDVLWPRSRRTVWHMQRYGLGALLHMDDAAARDFFDAFFAQRDWEHYLSGNGTPSEVAELMTAMYRAVDPPTRRALRRGELRGLWDASRRSARRGASV